LWSDNQVTDTAFNLAAGTYTVTVIDQNNCTSAETATINQPMTLTAVLSAVANVSCTGFSDGEAAATPSGGTAPYTYLWSNNSNSSAIASLSAGNYYVSINDAQGCEYIDSITITEPQQLVVAFSSSDDVSCFGSNDGLAVASGTGGTLPYSFFWNNNVFAATNNNLSAGKYLVTITDKNGCTDSSSTRISQPARLQSSVRTENISCFGFNDGVAVARVQGGNLPYTYNWSNNGSTDSLFSLQAGLYQLTVSDAKNCTDTSSGSISEPAPLALTVSNSDTICVNTSKTLIASASGGNGGYQFTWSDNLGANPVITVSPKQDKTYTIRVTDQNNCPQKTASVKLGVRNIFDDLLVLSATNDICLGDSTTLQYTFQGDYPSYTFSYNQGLSSQSPQFIKPVATTRYILTVTDICNNQLKDTAVVEVYEPPTISMNDTLIEGCEDLQVSFFNTTPTDYTYVWNFGDGSTSNEARPTHLYTEPGQYRVTLSVTSKEGCESQFTGNHRVLVNPTPQALIQANPTVTSIENALINFMGDFADANFWKWDFGNGVLSQSIDTSITYADTGTYMVSLFKENIFGCRDSAIQAIRIEPSYQIKIPNVFIPNTGGPTGGSYDPNDGSSGNANTVFHPFIEYTKRYHLMIFNRWGELVFESKDVNIGWDGYYKGKLSQADVYVYKLEVTFVNGSKATKVGDVTLLR
jgi:gliding motility-associated-like protein